MKAKVKKEFTDFIKDDIIEIINIDTVEDGVNVHFLARNQYHKCYFDDMLEVNEHLEFNCEEKNISAEVWITENESNRRIAECCKEKDKEIEYWKNKCMKLIDKF